MPQPSEQLLVQPSPEEEMLLALNSGNYDLAVNSTISGVQAGEAPGFMSVLRPDLLGNLSLRLWQTAATLPQTEADPEAYKTRLFNTYLAAAEQGDPAAMSALPKFATTIGNLLTATEVTLENMDAIAAWHTGRPYVQFIGSFNPQHVGHRSTIAATLEAAGANASGIVQVVQNHPIKKDSLPPYDGRFKQGEEKLYSSTLLDPTDVTLLDLPLGLGLAKQGTAQIELISSITGDDKLRWLVGSDKFMTDVNNVRSGKALDKAGVRFSNVHLYVARRDTQSLEEVMEGAAYVSEKFGANVTVIPESQDPLILGAAASKIRALRAEGRHEEADLMEYPDILSLKPNR
jgi:nicotinic acid mononucleotide adenylyltransferase